MFILAFVDSMAEFDLERKNSFIKTLPSEPGWSRTNDQPIMNSLLLKISPIRDPSPHNANPPGSREDFLFHEYQHFLEFIHRNTGSFHKDAGGCEPRNIPAGA